MDLPKLIEYSTPLLKWITPAECIPIFSTLTFTNFCVKQTISKCLSLGIMFGALILKFPLILNIIRARTSKGLSEPSLIIELFSAFINVAYNWLEGYPFQYWGEMAFITIQCAILVLLHWSYEKGNTKSRAGVAVAFLLFVAAVFQRRIPTSFNPVLAVLPIPCTLLARVPQIVKNAMQKHTGPLSMLSLGLSFGGNLARTFTSLQMAKPDLLILLGHGACALMNFILLSQVLIYWKNTNAVLAKSKGKKTN